MVLQTYVYMYYILIPYNFFILLLKYLCAKVNSILAGVWQEYGRSKAGVKAEVRQESDKNQAKREYDGAGANISAWL